MIRTRVLTAAAVTALAFPQTVATAQSRTTSQARPTPDAAATQPAQNPNVSVVAANVRRDLAQQVRAQQPPPQKKSGPLGKVASGLGLSKEQDVIARQVLYATIRPYLNTTQTTVAVVGSAEDRDRVVASLGEVRRLVRIVHIDAAYQDAAHENAVVAQGPIAKLGNVSVFYPTRSATKGDEPDKRLQSATISGSQWSALFTMDGDAVDLKALTSSNQSSSNQSTANASGAGPAVATTSDAPARSALREGDVVMPKLDGAKLHETELATSKVIGNAKTSEPLIVLEIKNGMVRVENAKISGWINGLMLTVKP